MRDVIEDRLKELKQKSFRELALLPQYEGEKSTSGGKVITVSVWKEMPDEHQIQIVVQGYRHWFLGIGYMHAQGFIIDDRGNMRDLATKEIYEFT